jgi:hypothetical protein
MRLSSFLTERQSIYGPGITFMDIDETILKTHARVQIKKDGKIIARLRNHEYLSYVPKDDEVADFSEYSDADVFYKTSEPVMPVIKRIQRMFKKIKERGSRVVIVSGREDLNDKAKFLETFRKFGVPIDDIYVERVGNIPEATTNLPQAKKKVIFKYLATGLYRRARLVDDSEHNCRAFLELEDELPATTITRIREKYSVPEGEPPISFYALKVLSNGSLQRIVRD